jgi:CubicO group peptidase (beta-lactamase class C family)
MCIQVTNSQEKQTYDLSTVYEKIQGWVDKKYYPVASLLIAKDNQIICERYFGNYKPQTVVYIASAGKWMAAATIAAVVDDGKLSWDDTVAKWLPEFTDDKGKATLSQLLSHTSGYPDYQPKGNRRDDYQTLIESVAHIQPLPPAFKPGEQFQYGGLAMQVAGRMAELASGRDWESLFQEKIAKPLGMTDTHFTPVDSGPGHAPMLGGGARCTLHDYGNFLSMISNNGLYNGRRILSEKSISQMQVDQVGNAKVYPGEFVEKVRGNKHTGIYGLGEWREILDDKGDAVLISSPSWTGAYPWIDKTCGVYGFFLTHVDESVANPAGFSAFYSSPVLATMVCQAVQKSERQQYN